MDILCILPNYISFYDFIGEDETFGLYGRLMNILVYFLFKKNN